MIGLASLVASLSLALAAPGTAQTPTTPDGSLQHPGTGWETATSDQAVVLTAGELVAVAGGVNWWRVACWTTAVAVTVAAGVGTGGAAAAAVGSALALGCLAAF